MTYQPPAKFVRARRAKSELNSETVETNGSKRSSRFMRSGACEFSPRFGNRATEFARGFNPFVNDFFGIFHCFGIALAVGHAAREFRHFNDEAVVVFAPVNDQFVTHSYSVSILYFKSNSRAPVLPDTALLSHH